MKKNYQTIAEEPTNHGLYHHFGPEFFNEQDKRLREAGFYCEQIVPSDALPRVLRQMARTIGAPNFYKFIIIPAEEVTFRDKMRGKSALYMQIEGRTISLDLESELEQEASAQRQPSVKGEGSPKDFLILDPNKHPIIEIANFHLGRSPSASEG